MIIKKMDEAFELYKFLYNNTDKYFMLDFKGQPIKLGLFIL
jgi:hypothetical protein